MVFYLSAIFLNQTGIDVLKNFNKNSTTKPLNLMNYLCLHNLRKLVSATKGNILFCNYYNNMFS